MGAVDDYYDFLASGDLVSAFETAQEILARKVSKRLMAAWIDDCVEILHKLGKEYLLPTNFDDYSVYGQREKILQIRLR